MSIFIPVIDNTVGFIFNIIILIFLDENAKRISYMYLTKFEYYTLYATKNKVQGLLYWYFIDTMG